MSRVTLKTVAAQAGVGSATVERVLNGRGGVSPTLVDKVLTAAHKLGYPKRLPDLHRAVTRIEVLMLRPELSFINRLSRSFERIAANLHSSIVLHRTFLDENNLQEIAARIAKPTLRRSALIVVLPDHPVIRAALNAVRQAGLPVIQLVTPMKEMEDDYIGIDNRAAGRMAGLMMSGMQRKPGAVVVLCHSQHYGVHRNRVRGFSEFMEKPASSHLDFRTITFTQDNDLEAARIVAGLLNSTPDLVGLYSTGGDYGPLCDVLRRNRRAAEICFIGHELTEQTAAALRDGMMAAVIDQAPEAQARRALDTILHRLGLLESDVDTAPIRFVTVTAQNL